MKNYIEELKWRGMVHDVMPGTEEMLNKEMTAGYAGFDPTAASLTIGNLVSVMLLVHLQRAGHKPLALIGGATGMIGDPSGKAEERKFLSEETLRHNQECFKKQLSKFLDFNCGASSAEIVNNYDWFKDFGFLRFLPIQNFPTSFYRVMISSIYLKRKIAEYRWGDQTNGEILQQAQS
jgi:tyrosyl-tRNA synthetase